MKTMLSLTIAFIFSVSLFGQEQSKTTTLKTFLAGIITFQDGDVNEAEPLINIKILADSNADKKIELTKENILAALDEIGKYKNAVIIVGIHTIVKITDAKNCKQSGAWAACMPFGSGLIQKSGAFISSEDYINNIMGIPDSQKRTLYLFN
ncbi:MAG: hypothetical protein K9H16_08315 [Bacteroidales bacterium]|nr:hypothetical protein [Bacteroidales bacterium]